MTDPPQGSILARTAAGANWLVAWRFANRALGLVSTLIVIRMLAPDDFGLITLAFSFTQSVESLTQLGTEDQVIRSRMPTRELYDTAFTLNAARASLIALLIIAGSHPVAAWFGDARLQPLLLAIAGQTFLTGLGNVRTADFERTLEFQRIFLLNALPRTFQVGITILSVYMLRSYWGLVIGLLSGSVSKLCLGYVLRPYLPRISLAARDELFSVSLWTWLTSVVSVLRDRVEMFIIGRTFGTVEAGLYSIAFELATMPLVEMVSPISHAAMPGFAASFRAQGLGQTAEAFERIFALVILLALPLGFGMSLVAGPLVTVAIGLRWADAAPLMMLFAVMAVPMPPGEIAAALLTARARLRLRFAITSLAGILRAGIAIGVSRHHGLAGIAIGMGIGVLVERWLLVLGAYRTLALPLSRPLRFLWRPAIAAAVMILVLHLAGLAWLMPPPHAATAAASLLGACGLGAVAFVCAAGLLWALSGRGPGPETDLVLLMHQNVHAVRRRILAPRRR